MDAPTYELFSPAYFIRQLNMALPKEERSVRLAAYTEHKPLLPFLEKPGNCAGTFVLDHNAPSVLFDALNYDDWKILGNVKLQVRAVEDHFNQKFQLDLYSPLTLSSGKQIPPCSIKMSRTAYEDFRGQIRREDSLLRLMGFRTSADFRDVLPTSWFSPEIHEGSQSHQGIESLLSKV